MQTYQEGQDKRKRKPVDRNDGTVVYQREPVHESIDSDDTSSAFDFNLNQRQRQSKKRRRSVDDSQEARRREQQTRPRSRVVDDDDDQDDVTSVNAVQAKRVSK